ncbi:peptide chain release factor N(5)-glutamine methyltransferase [Flavobacterium sp. UMI-01]|uniref:peptide chain release factor N(5)-glutamine methyltransferase n=1 Tax=Flavobacterium sp. UMI-01 TaxID=1441053 RepID=UPI001C7D8A9D|nr:peptide chain release factor N(5)-glutamine methyltransferase [Flavobacterium sp. UMI-01]
MTIRNYRDRFVQELSSQYDADEAASFFYLILEKQRQLRRVDVALQPNLVFSETELVFWNDILQKLQQEIPIQYLLGTTSFYGLEFEVNSNVLIPRPETEELVDWIVSKNQKTAHKIKILDIGTGSGCIAITLAKKLPHAEVYAIDVSEGALETAQRNALKNDVYVQFIKQNILETTDLGQLFDVIVSNPPYVRNLEKQEIKKNVLEYEPHLALFVADDNALVFYTKIAQLAQKNVVVGGQLFFEINQYLGQEMITLLQQLHFNNIELRKDIYGNDRMIGCSV